MKDLPGKLSQKKGYETATASAPPSRARIVPALGIISGIIHVANICSRDFYELLRLQLRISLRAFGVVHANISGLH